MIRRVNLSPGIMLILVGILILLDRLSILSLGQTWPLIVICLGLVFHLEFILSGSRAAGVLVPGGILTVIGLLFLFCTFFGWENMNLFWPLFILAPAVGLFELYIFGGRERGLLVSVLVLTIVSAVFLIQSFFGYGYQILLPIGLIAAGIVLLLGNLGHHRHMPPPQQQPPQPPPPSQ